MIQTISDLMEEMIKVERVLMKAEKITHRPTIGSMWEGLSRDVLKTAIPVRGLGVSSGFIEGDSGRLSAELDCLLVCGSGRAVHRSEKRIFQPNEVIAIIQVKKNLYQKDVKEGFENLESILHHNEKWEGKRFETVKQSFQIITQTPLPADIATLPPFLGHLFNSLVGDAVLPCRIILGYHGFKTEKNFRQGLIDYFDKLEPELGWGPAGYPNLIVGPNAVAVKNTAMPWGAAISDGWWPLILTSGTMKPCMALLEVIWSRLNYMGLIGHELFGDDLRLDGLTPLLDVRLIDDCSWEMSLRTADIDENEPPEESFQWEPEFVSVSALTVILMLRESNPLDVSQFEDDVEINEGIRELQEAGIVGRDVSSPMLISFLTSYCVTAMLSDGRIAVAEDNTGRLDRWLANFLEKSRNEAAENTTE